LLRNAAQVSTRGDRIHIETFMDSHDPGRVGLRMRDEGPGIPEDIRDRIFDPFFTTRDDGRGLGLATVATVARRHGGTAARIDVDHGTCFEVQLHLTPVAKPAQATPPPEAPEVDDHADSGTVLVVDDEPASLQVTAKMLRRLGFEAIEAASGAAALAHLNAETPELVAALVDAHMPGMNGLETADALRARLPRLPIIMISGYQSPEDAFGQSGDIAHGFIGKPFVRAQLERALRDARQRAASET
ncbi:MAG: response regulator, partial [Pseudomonadales bacterium]|nr:response regulator [Pseudomonadales bacterium]